VSVKQGDPVQYYRDGVLTSSRVVIVYVCDKCGNRMLGVGRSIVSLGNNNTCRCANKIMTVENDYVIHEDQCI